ncbi:pectinesterase/pectinesterase inhibitor PPE8B-like isoform X3 [Papaver somniferum]|uniref:pectinesterase/pectinesterase inhibitor PPE8B-like isoform X3 n=1 Tax=Papaver somniferum TaxID=3469 RepID=UPI000E70055B|nr:pectinesterase/pectinesterase inhibitor PPE8B-like isoform X3 [Papaver somniferum]
MFRENLTTLSKIYIFSYSTSFLRFIYNGNVSSSRKLINRANPIHMASSSCSLLSFRLLLLMLLCISVTVLGSSPDEENYSDSDIIDDGFLQKECLTTPTSVFLKSVRLAIEEVEKVTSIVSKFTGAFSHNFRLSHAVTDCLDLLDFTAQELSWTLNSAQQHLLHHHLRNNTPGTWWQPTWNRGRKNGERPSSLPSTSRSSSRLLADDLRSWLSAALGNQDTCIEGFEKTSSIFVQHMIAGGLKHVTSLVSDVLSMVRHEEHHQRHRDRNFAGQTVNKVAKREKRRNFPSWMHIRDRRLLQLTPPSPPPPPPTINNNGTANATSYGNMTINVVVAADGSGNFTKIMDAVAAAPDKSTNRFIIYIKRGIYNENVDIKKKKWNLMMIGDGMNATVITGNRSFIDGWTTFRTATFAVSGRGFIAKDLMIENTAGAVKHQAVALRSDSDLSVFYRCAITGYQDTLYAHSLRQFYRECLITGTVDFIFGNGAVVFQKCDILARKPLPDQKNSITAQGRKDPNQNTGFSIQFSNISADSDLAAAASVPSYNASTNITTRPTQTYLGRPWKLYSRTVIMKCYLGDLIRPEGWLEWNATFALDTLFYAEYMNYGPGAGLGKRVNWPGYQIINDSSQAINFTVARFVDGNSWLPSTGVTYTAGLDM